MMLAKLSGFLKAAFYKLRYRCRIHFSGVPVLEGNSKVKVESGLARIGHSFWMKSGAYCAVVSGGQLQIGNQVYFNRNSIAICRNSITIGDHCSIAPNVLIYDHDHNFGPEGIRSGYHTAPVVIESHCWIGAGVTILRGTHIGEGSVIGAGCVVSGTIPPHSLVTANRTLKIVPIEDRSL